MYRLPLWLMFLTTSSILTSLYRSPLPGSNLHPLSLPTQPPIHSVASANPGWSLTDPLHAARWGHSATLLPDGKVLVAGGGMAAAELYDPATGTWSLTGSMHMSRSGHSAILLLDGTVLVAGGFTGTAVASAEVYNPATGTWREVGRMNTARGAPAAARLPDGRVLITGGYDHPHAHYASAEIYDPATETWHAARPMMEPRANHTATLLPDGKVLVAGGYMVGRFQVSTPYSAEVYNPVTDIWQRVGDLAVRRGNHTATLLPNGMVLVTGGITVIQGQAETQATAEVYDPATTQWHMAGRMQEARRVHRAALLPNGQVVVTGGFRGTVLASVEVYDIQRNVWYRLPDLNVARYEHTLTFVAPDTLLVAGGLGDATTTASSELYHVSDIPSLIPQYYFPLMKKMQ